MSEREPAAPIPETGYRQLGGPWRTVRASGALLGVGEARAYRERWQDVQARFCR